MTTQTYHTRMSFHPNFPSSFLLSSLGHPFRVTHPVPIRLLELSSKHMYTWLEISHNLFQFYKPKPTKLVVIQEIACRLEQRNTGFQLRQFKTWRWCRGTNPNSTTKVTCKKSDSKNGMWVHCVGWGYRYYPNEGPCTQGRENGGLILVIPVVKGITWRISQHFIFKKFPSWYLVIIRI